MARGIPGSYSQFRIMTRGILESSMGVWGQVFYLSIAGKKNICPFVLDFCFFNFYNYLSFQEIQVQGGKNDNASRRDSPERSGRDIEERENIYP
jgi:hypothetical protein